MSFTITIVPLILETPPLRHWSAKTEIAELSRMPFGRLWFPPGTGDAS
jgi:hypothetical protein